MIDRDDDELSGLSGDEKIVQEAKDRFKRAREYESEFRTHYLDDMKFSIGDSENGFQWPDDVSRRTSGKVQLTINKVRTHCLQIINDAKQNKPGVKISATGNGSTFEAAQTFEGLVRHIEYNSNAQAAYDRAVETQVRGGIGYLRVVTDWVDDNTFDQDLFIRSIRDPMSVYMDPDAQETDKSDARWAFVFEDMPRDEFKRQFPGIIDDIGSETINSDDDWIKDKDHVRVAEYYRRVKKKDRLLVVDAGGNRKEMRASDIDPPILKELDALKGDEKPRERQVETDVVEWFKIAGNEIVDRRDGKDPWPGKFIPIAPVIGEEFVIEGKLYRNGHVRNLKDPQRQYNYWTSAATEGVALQNKSPYIAPARAIEGHQTYWETANTEAHAILPYNDIDDSGQPIQRPQREQPPVMAPAFIAGMQQTENQMMMVSGQYQAQMGENENAKSGRAISERQRQGDNATYHFIDGQAAGIRCIGKILIDLIPKIYDTKRVIRVLAKDGTDNEVVIDPQAQAAYFKEQQQTAEQAREIFNPNVGRYEVHADIGPAYSTQRQEAFDAFEKLIVADNGLIQIIGDIAFANADFPGADKIAARLKKGVPPQYQDDGPDPAVVAAQQQAQQQVAQAHGMLAKVMQENAKLQLELKNKNTGHKIEAYDAETKRLTAIGNSGPIVTPDQALPLFEQLRQMMAQTGDLDGDAVKAAPQPAPAEQMQ